ncbi:MAG: substrate-binding domain-containing protein [Chthoniobacteraceae bacterium]
MTEPTCVCHVGALRERLGISQAELARRAGLSRQLVNMVERGRIVPSVLTALALADALQCTVPDLFQKPQTDHPLEVTLSSSVHSPEGPVRLALVGERWIAIPVAGSEAAGFGEADGDLVARRGNSGSVKILQPEAQLRQNILVAGCDPALGIVRDLWRTSHGEGRVRWQNLSSTAAIKALAAGEAHIAGVHFPDEKAEQRALKTLGTEAVVVRFARWEQGWMIRRGNPLGFRSVEDLASNRVRFLNRVDGSGSRLLIDGLLEKAGVPPSEVPLYSTVASSHFDCAGAIREGRADVAMGLKAVAESCDLDFLPVQEVAFDLIIPKTLLDFAPVAKLLDFLQNRDFRRQLDGLPGYGTKETGKIVS